LIGLDWYLMAGPASAGMYRCCSCSLWDSLCLYLR